MSASARLRSVGRGVGAVLTALPVAIAVKDNVVDYCAALGVSMQPTINPTPDAETLRKYFFARYWQDIVMVDKLSIRAGRYERGSVVLCQSVEDPTRFLIKRLVAVEGDWVEDREGNYVHIGKGQGWLEGDNAEHSIDSNEFGPVPLGLIQGTVRYVCWPPWRISSIDAGTLRRNNSRVRSRPYQIEADAKRKALIAANLKRREDMKKSNENDDGETENQKQGNGEKSEVDEVETARGRLRRVTAEDVDGHVFDMTPEAMEIERFLARVDEIKDEFGLNGPRTPDAESDDEDDDEV
ncbi:Mitochondrial inner membrane protease subunit 2 [Hondaea fermentalgiana]|uniref:Mitochondrial inner membrane protease subunit 2 n=1 Tax=Hondaea fermentalgiana TaxID=2315210 RepID=A0A2R5G9B2_9STRA|nr:Mitochondrial inner membrane protease subunit 2 [Hondaea fermentalgiana]|eukprot:GBG27632.1 Mitochondrial inner membrane protease subunit 2 [Hondaea fermentalgiana]